MTCASRRCANWTTRTAMRARSPQGRWRPLLSLTTGKMEAIAFAHREDGGHCFRSPQGRWRPLLSLTTGKMEAIAFVHLGCPAVDPLGHGNKKQKQIQFVKYRSASTWNGNNKRAGASAGGCAGGAKRHKQGHPTSPPRQSLNDRTSGPPRHGGGGGEGVCVPGGPWRTGRGKGAPLAGAPAKPRRQPEGHGRRRSRRSVLGGEGGGGGGARKPGAPLSTQHAALRTQSFLLFITRWHQVLGGRAAEAPHPTHPHTGSRAGTTCTQEGRGARDEDGERAREREREAGIRNERERERAPAVVLPVLRQLAAGLVVNWVLLLGWFWPDGGAASC
jgi:hypothetical protein